MIGRAAELDAGDVVLEVGGGLGVLSEYLTAPLGAAPPIRRTESMMNSFCVMSRISAGMTSGSLSSSLTVIRGASL